MTPMHVQRTESRRGRVVSWRWSYALRPDAVCGDGKSVDSTLCATGVGSFPALSDMQSDRAITGAFLGSRGRGALCSQFNNCGCDEDNAARHTS